MMPWKTAASPKQDLADRFGPVVADLVDGLTKLDKLHFNTREESQAESFRKMLLAMAKDVRVILIKLADRTHNMRTMGDMPRSKWGRIASETLEIYAPIAHRLGLNQTYRELQDLSFHYQNPWRYATLEKAITKSRARRHDLVLRVQNEIAAEFDRVNMSVRLAGRESTLYSLYQKMLRHHLTFAQVTDIYGFRIIVPTVTDCYTALGILHQMYKPVPGKFKDHIAIAKSNGYQSLHTMLVGPSGVNIEFQIRTEPMHIVAEAGIAAHWLYKSRASEESLNTKWLQSLLDIQTETNDATEFWDNVKVDLFPRLHLRVHAQEQNHGHAARRHGSGLCLRYSQQHRPPYRLCADQWRARIAAHRTQKWRRGANHHGRQCHPQPRVAGVCQNRTRALQDSQLPENSRPQRIHGTGRNLTHPSPARRRHRCHPCQ